jgi:hypothetical protein
MEWPMRTFSFALILRLIFVFSQVCVAAEGWILWQSTPQKVWLIVAGYPTYDSCLIKSLEKKMNSSLVWDGLKWM